MTKLKLKKLPGSNHKWQLAKGPLKIEKTIKSRGPF